MVKVFSIFIYEDVMLEDVCSSVCFFKYSKGEEFRVIFWAQIRINSETFSTYSPHERTQIKNVNEMMNGLKFCFSYFNLTKLRLICLH